MRKVFDVKIHNKDYAVYSIEGKEHEGFNDIPKSWWIYYSSIPFEGEQPPIDSPNWEPFSSSILRLCWEFKIKQSNSSKEKWGEVQFRNHTQVEMWCNGKLVYTFGTSGKSLDFAMAKIQYLQVILLEHPYNFLNPDEEVGRKICWYGLPATIAKGYDPGEIRIIPDYTVGLTKDDWWKELKNRKKIHTEKNDWDDDSDIEEEYDMDGYQNDMINWGDALSDQHIYWFRK